MHAELVLHIIRHIHAASSHCASTYDGFTAQSVQLRRVLHQGNTHLHQHNTHIGGKSCRVGGVLTNARHKPTSPLRKQFPKPAQIGLVSSTIPLLPTRYGWYFRRHALRRGDNSKALPTVSLFLISRNHSGVGPCDIRMWMLRQPSSDTGQFNGNIRIIAVFKVRQRAVHRFSRRNKITFFDCGLHEFPCVFHHFHQACTTLDEIRSMRQSSSTPVSRPLHAKHIHADPVPSLYAMTRTCPR